MSKSKGRSPRPSIMVHLALVLALLISACSTAADEVESGTDDSATQTSTGVGDGESPGEVPDTRADGTPPQTATTTGSAAPSSDSPKGPAAGPTDTTPAAAAGELPALGGPGSYAGHFLRTAPRGADQIVLDVFVAPGAEPQSATITHVTNVLAQASQKPIDLRQGRIDAPDKSWTADELRSLGDRNGPSNTVDVGVIKIFFLRGDYAGDDGVLGIAVRSDVAAVFVDKIREATGLLDSPSAVERAVTTHEVGHLLGMVDLFLQTGRDDPEHPKHSSNPDSVMYWAVESVFISQLVEGEPPSTFDAADMADFVAIRNS